MYILVSLLTITIGAILNWAVTDQVGDFSWNTTGAILLAVGGLGLLISIIVEILNYKDRHPSA